MAIKTVSHWSKYKNVDQCDRIESPEIDSYKYGQLGFPCGSAGKESTGNAGDLGSIPGLGRSPGKGKGYPLQYSDQENSMDYIVHGGHKELDMTERPKTYIIKKQDKHGELIFDRDVKSNQWRKDCLFNKESWTSMCKTSTHTSQLIPPPPKLKEILHLNTKCKTSKFLEENKRKFLWLRVRQRFLRIQKAQIIKGTMDKSDLVEI